MTTAQQGAAASKSTRSWWSVITEWRNWRIPAKLIAVLLIPMVTAFVLGVLRISSEISKSQSYERIDGLVAVQTKLHSLVNDVQDERTYSAEYLGGTGVSDPAILVRQADRVDTDAREMRTSVATLDPVIAEKFGQIASQFGALPQLRQHIRGNTTDAATSQAAYTTVIDALLGFDQTLVSQFGDPALASTASGVSGVLYAEEQIDQEHSIVSAGLGRGHFLPIELQTLRDSTVRLEDKLADVRVVATPEQLKLFDTVISSPVVAERHAMLATVLLAPVDPAAQKRGKNPPPPINPDDWNRVSNDSTSHIRQAESTVSGQMRVFSAAQQDRASNQAGAESVILLTALLLALALLALVGRGLLGPLGVLRRAALDVAERRLPAAVAKVRDGQLTDTTIEPVPINTTEEIGQLARAVDAMHGQAVRLAAEQASLRQNLNTTFINVSRRSQSLVERLLRQLEQLEKNEEDPDQLSNLFKLDHLATRMRRNNENLMVLSGNDLARRAAQPLGLGDVLRAAVSEIDQYERVLVRPSPSVQVAGYVSGDLVRLLAELLDNAAQYSSPETQVTIASHQSVDGKVTIEVLDEGIGMSEDELSKANERLSEAGSADSGVSRQMGLFVVSKLAARHGVVVTLSGGDEGILARVVLPEEVMVATSDRGGFADAGGISPATAGRTNGSSTNRAMSGLFGQLGTPLPPIERDEPAASPAEATGDWDAAELDRWSTGSDAAYTGDQPIPAPPRPGLPTPRAQTSRASEPMPDSFAPFESPFTGLSNVNSSSATDLFKPVKEPEEAPDYEWDNDSAGSVYPLGSSPLGGSALGGSALGGSALGGSPLGSSTSSDSAVEKSALADHEGGESAGASFGGSASPLSTNDVTSTGWFEAIADPAATTQEPEEWFGVEGLSEVESAESRPAEAELAGFANWDNGGRTGGEDSKTSARESADWLSDNLGSGRDQAGREQTASESVAPTRSTGSTRNKTAAGVPFSTQITSTRQGKTSKTAEGTSWNLSPATRPGHDAKSTADDQVNPPQVANPASGVPPLPKRKPKKSAIGQGKQAGSEPTPAESPEPTGAAESAASTAKPAPQQSSGATQSPAGAQRPLPKRTPGKQTQPKQAPSEPAPSAEAPSAPAPSPQPAASPNPGPASREVPAPNPMQWSSPADAGWQAARELAEAQPASHTSAGLPRRVPKAHLLPGSAGPAAGSGASAPPNRNAADVRGRLNSLQSGIRDGRHRRSAAPEEHSDNGQEGDRS